MCKSKSTKFNCKLCNQETAERIQYFRGLDLCGTCENCLKGGDYSAKIIADELKAMRRGTMVVDRAPLPASARYFFAGFQRPACDPIAAEARAAQRAEQTAADLATLCLERQVAAVVADFAPADPARPTFAELTMPPVAVESHPSRKPSKPRPRRNPQPARNHKSNPADDWRSNARRLVLAIHV